MGKEKLSTRKALTQRAWRAKDKALTAILLASGL